jgi:uncharacterized membrane protein
LDYSHHKLNFQGRICLTNSLAWGFLGVGFINYIHPFVSSVIVQIPQNVLCCIVYGGSAVIIVDTIISIIKINSIKEKLQKIQELEEEIKCKLSEIKELGKNKVPDKEKLTENVQETLYQLKIKKNKMIRNLYRYVYRIKKTFPAINTKEITQILNKKFLTKKEITKEKRGK